MPKSRNRKNHKKKVQARNMRLEVQQKQMLEKFDDLKEQYVQEMADKAKQSSEEDSGDVPFTLGKNT